MAKRIQLLTMVGVVLFLGWSLVDSAGGASKKRIITNLKLIPDVPEVELFTGIKNQKLATRVYPMSAYNSSVFITNLTQQPLTVKVPPAVSSVHILAQVGQDKGLLDGLLDNPQSQKGKSQSVGGNLSPVGNNQKLDFQGLFTIPAEKTVRLRLRSVCLEHGKPSPSSLKTYELRPIESEVKDEALVLILKKFDPRYDDWEMVQAIAWHLSSHMNWRELANQKKNLSIGGGIPQFSSAQLMNAKKIVEMAQIQVNKKQPSGTRQEFSDTKTDSGPVTTLTRIRGERR
ncbi:MAG: hypothetical protein K0U86_07120 [Planctomycetes bacterium]|nr:hypothetical protein [Planctomycetota bacterium]MCH9724660.1 hypothetical protein [Planctomycetota bacterium]MCH9774811.1 hypothetical protein [Planctomycetota bacterium]MDF1745818.1 hypothetical protein [Gimesia sp.]